MTPDDDTRITWNINRGNCPDCGSRGFVLGPRGGAAINVECASTACRSRFNVTTFGPQVVLAQRIDNGGPWGSEPQPGVPVIAWSCGHTAGSFCAACFHELAGKANKLAEENMMLWGRIDDLERKEEP